jgi:hypothetical protein
LKEDTDDFGYDDMFSFGKYLMYNLQNSIGGGGLSPVYGSGNHFRAWLVWMNYIIHLIVSSVFMLNFIIAILSNSY